MNITINLKENEVGKPPFEFPKYGVKAHWTPEGRIQVICVVTRQDGGIHLMEDTIDAPLTEDELHLINESNQHQERE